jgi:hypothetical protein
MNEIKITIEKEVGLPAAVSAVEPHVHRMAGLAGMVDGGRARDTPAQKGAAGQAAVHSVRRKCHAAHRRLVKVKVLPRHSRKVRNLQSAGEG